MSIVSFNVQAPMLQGIAPRTVQLVTTDNLATITAAGYMNKQGQVLQGENLIPTDIINVIYSYSTSTNSGTFGIFTPSIAANNTITLVQWANPGDILLPVVSGDVATFNGTTGQIKDSGVAFSNASDTVASLFHGTATAGDFVTVNNANKTIQDSGAAPSAAAQPFVVMSPGTLTSGNFPRLNDANGTLNAGKAPSDATKTFVVMSPGAVTSGNLAKFGDANGTVADQGVAFKSVGLAAVAGGAAAQTVTDSFCTSTSCVVAVWNDTTNPVNIQKVAAGNGSFVVTSSADPGASHINYIITK